MLFPDILMLLALTSSSNVSSQRTGSNPSMICKSAGEIKLVIHKQLWTKPAAEYRVREIRDSKKKLKCTVTVKIYYFDPKKIKSILSNELDC